MSDNRYRALVIGTGKIGALLDAPDSASILTHCHAYRRNPRIELCGVYDLDAKQAALAGARWGVPAFSNLSEAVSKARPDIVSVCTPAQNRAAMLRQLLAQVTPRYLFIEKPISENAQELACIVELTAHKDFGAQANYIRNFDPAMGELKQKIAAGELGALQRGVFFYGKGFKNNGSHLLQLLSMLFGTPDEFQVGDALADESRDDRTFEVKLHWRQGGAVTLMPLNEECYSTIEGVFYFEKARVHLKQFGIQWNIAPVREDPVFPGYRDLDETAPWRDSGVLEALPIAVEKMVRELDSGEIDRSSWARVLEIEGLMHRISGSKGK